MLSHALVALRVEVGVLSISPYLVVTVGDLINVCLKVLKRFVESGKCSTDSNLDSEIHLGLCPEIWVAIQILRSLEREERRYFSGSWERFLKKSRCERVKQAIHSQDSSWLKLT